MVHVGCCGYSVAKSKYHESFDLIELQQTFYQPPNPRVMQSWRDGAPEGFSFVVKAWQLITHDPLSPTYGKLKSPVPDFKRLNYGFFRPTAEVRRAWDTTQKAADVLRAGIIVFQCPPSFKPTAENIENMRRFFGGMKRAGRVFVWEPRGYWKDDEIRSVCEELDLVHCSDPFRREPVYGKIKYLRLQGKGGYKYTFTEKDMVELIDRYGRGSEAYIMFNNSNMYNDALKFKDLLAAPDPA